MNRIMCALILCAASGQIFGVDIDRSSEPVSLNGAATLEWGYNLDTGANGFKNSSSLAMTIPLVGKDVHYSKEKPGVYGFIELKDVEWELNQAVGGTLSPGVSGGISAKVVWDSFFLGVFGIPAFSINKNVLVAEDDNGDVGFSGFAGYKYGTTLGFASDESPFELSVKIVSMEEDWRNNTESDYEFGADATYYVLPGLLDIKGSFATRKGADFVAYGGLELPIYLEVANSLTVTPAADFRYAYDVFAFDAGAIAVMDLSNKNEDKVSAGMEVKAFYGSDEDVSFRASFFEPPVGGLVDLFGFNAFVSVVDVLESAPAQWYTGGGTSYRFRFDDATSLEPSVELKTDFEDARSLKVLVAFKSVAIANTTITVTYTSENYLAADPLFGEIVAKCIIKY